LPDLSERSEIEKDLLAKLVLACGDVSLVNFVRVGEGAMPTAGYANAAARNALKSGCQVVGDIQAMPAAGFAYAAAFDSPRLAHLGCEIATLIDNLHITNVLEAEQEFWQHQFWQQRLQQLKPGAIYMLPQF